MLAGLDRWPYGRVWNQAGRSDLGVSMHGGLEDGLVCPMEDSHAEGPSPRNREHSHELIDF